MISRRTGEPIAFHAGQADADIGSPTSKRPAHLRQRRSRPAGSRSTTPPPTAPRRSTPTPLAKAAKAHAVQAPRERRLPARHRLQGVLLHRDRRHRTPTSRPATPVRRLRRRLPQLASRRRRRHRARSSLSAGGDIAHTGFDNIAFVDAPTSSSSSRTPATASTPSATRWTPATLLRRRATTTRPGAHRRSFLAEGRDASATIDAGLPAGPAYNDGDNEITGIHVSDGDPTVAGPARRQGAARRSTQRLARLLDPAARRQQHVRGVTRLVAGCSQPSKAPPSWPTAGLACGAWPRREALRRHRPCARSRS